ncbi:hypothetical protein ACLQ2R_29725 [Streptosporangium sp. DT93]|uniref:hypothetical protein n=1 Tax=Streptosporangium sp. DT93 TaxID=3393428 RepID=UPI003CFA939C
MKDGNTIGKIVKAAGVAAVASAAIFGSVAVVSVASADVEGTVIGPANVLAGGPGFVRW